MCLTLVSIQDMIDALQNEVEPQDKRIESMLTLQVMTGILLM